MLRFVNLLLMLVIIIKFDKISTNTGTTNSIKEEACTPGKIYKKDCNNCECSSDRTLVCSKMICLNQTITSRIKEIMKKTHKRRLDDNHIRHQPSSQCTSGDLYRDDCKLCFCNENGISICKPKYCNRRKHTEIKPIQMVPSLSPEEFSSLPSLPDTSASCSPGKTYRVNCNTCICLQNGDLICDEKLCLDYNYFNAKEAKHFNGTSCDLKNEADRYECIRCNCKKDKLVCNAVLDCKPETRRSHGDGDLPKSSIDLKKELCEKGNNYMIDCNKCFCFDSDNIRCTMKTCLKHSDTEFFKQKMKVLGKSIYL